MGALPPLGRFKGFAKGEIEIPLCRPFLFTVNGFFFPAQGTKKGLKRFPRLWRGMIPPVNPDTRADSGASPSYSFPLWLSFATLPSNPTSRPSAAARSRTLI